MGSGSDFTGFNRAIDAKRQVGSLLKPVIYLTAFQSGQYNLTTPVMTPKPAIPSMVAHGHPKIMAVNLMAAYHY